MSLFVFGRRPLRRHRRRFLLYAPPVISQSVDFSSKSQDFCHLSISSNSHDVVFSGQTKLVRPLFVKVESNLGYKKRVVISNVLSFFHGARGGLNVDFLAKQVDIEYNNSVVLFDEGIDFLDKYGSSYKTMELSKNKKLAIVPFVSGDIPSGNVRISSEISAECY